MNSRRVWSLIALVAILLGLLPAMTLAQDGEKAATPQPAAADKLEPQLLDLFAVKGTGDFIVRFAAQADLSPAYNMGWTERGEFVYNTLKDTAAQSQSAAKEILDKQGLTYQTFIAGNELYVYVGDLDAANTLAALPEVASIRAPRTYYIDPIIAADPVLPEATIDWGITDTKADQFWTQYGIKGEGIIVSNIDTGVQWNHPALVNQFKCTDNPGDPACWSDPSNVCGGSMCDNNGHGTHTMGTMVSKDDPSLTYIAGMAPNAQWIACKGCESSSCSETALNTCADWILAPGGSAANRPHIVNNSWGGGGGDDWYQAKVQAWQAAGIFPAFSAGNSTGCGSLGSPGDYQESFGTTGHNSSRTHVYAQGPSDFGHDPYTKPNISAPASSVCSTVPTNSWSCSYSGTSMASPHTAGAVALLWSCNASLVGQMAATFEALQSTADAPNPANPSCGVPPDGEGTYEDGYGYLNVLEAGLQYCVSGWGAINGYVRDAVTSAPINGASVTGYRDAGGSWTADTNVTGYYSMTVGAGTYAVEAVHPQYATGSVSDLDVLTDTVVTQDFYLQPRGHLYGTVTDQDSGAPLAATVSVAGGPSTATNPATGYYELYLDAGTYDVTASAPDYADESASISLAVGEQEQHDFTLLAAIAVVPDPIQISIEMGQTGTVASQMTNNMAVPYPFEFREKDAPARALAGEDILVVRKDSTAATAMEAALTTLGVSFLGVTDTAFQAMSVPDLLAYQAVFYAGGTGASGTPGASENLLVAYLDAGGQLYISDNDLGYSRHGSVFYDTYLQATYVADNGGELLIGEDLMAGLNPDVTSDPYPDSFTVGAEGTRLFKWSTADNAGGVLVQRSGYQAIYTSFDFQQIAAVADETELINRIFGLFLTSDVLWFDTSISGGTVPGGGMINWTNAFSATTAAGIGQPGGYDALLRIVPVDDPSLPDKQIAVHMTVLPSIDFGQIAGTVTGDRPGGPLEANILIEATDGTTVALTTDPATGQYSYWLEEGTYDVTASAGGYVPETASVTIVGQQVTPQDFELALNSPEIVVSPSSLVETLQFGQTGVQALTIANDGLQPLDWELREANAGRIQVNDILLMADDVTTADWDVYRAALDAAGVSWDEWNLGSLSFPTAADLEPYSLLIWADESVVDAGDAECQIVVDWLTGGGKSLFVTSVDFLWDLQNGTIGGGEHNLYLLLNTTYQGDYAGTGITVLNGVAGDPIGGDFVEPDGLTLTATADSNGDYANLTSVATTGLIYGPGGTGSNYAGLSHYEGANYKTVWLGVNFHNGLTVPAQRETLMSNILSFLGGGGDVPWLSESPTSGTLQPGESVNVDVTFDSTMVPEPGVYEAVLRAMSNDPLNSRVDVPVTMNVLPSGDIGLLEGIVTSDRPGGPLEAEVLIEATSGMTWTVPTHPASGYYYKWLVAGTYSLVASADGYIPGTADVTITGMQTTTQDFELVLMAPEIAVDPASLEQTLEMGQTAVQALGISNLGNEPLTFEIVERNGDFFPDRAGEDILVVRHDATAATAMETALTALGYTYLGVTDAEFQAMTVDQLLAYQAVFHAGVTGLSGNPSASEILLVAYLDAGGSLFVSDNDLGYYRHGSTFYDAYLQATYDVDNGGDYLDGLDLMAGLTLDISADPYPDGITVGAEGTAIFEFQGGAEQNGVAVDRNGYRAIYTGFDYHYIADPAQEVEVINRVLGFIAAGDVPWLSEDPITGTVAAGGTVPVEVTFDAGVAAEPGTYTAALRVKHNDPLAQPVNVPVTLTVVPSGDYGSLEGVVSGLGYCDEDPAPLEAEVLIEAEDGSSWTVPSDPTTGAYFRWLLAGTYTVTASAEEHLDATAVVQVTAQQSTIQDLDLRYIASCMDVTPTTFSLTLPADTQLTELLTIDNSGVGELAWELHETTRTLGLNAPAQDVVVRVPAIAASPNAATRGKPQSFPAREFRVHVGRVSAEPIDVLLVTPDVVGGGDISLLLNTLAAFPDLTVTIWDGNAGTPTVVDMQAHDVVFVGNDILWTSSAIDATQLSNTLADYIDAGGKVLAGSFLWSYDEWGLAGGRFLTEDYSPFEMATTDFFEPATLGDYDAGHPLMAGITTITDNFNHQDTDLSSNGTWVASWDDGWNFVAVAPNCVGLNQEYFYNADFGGQTGELLHNALLYLGGEEPWSDVPWVTEVPTNGIVGPDSSFDVEVTFDATGLTVGECYTASLGLVHDDPGWETPFYIPLQLCVTEEPENYFVYLPLVAKGYEPTR